MTPPEAERKGDQPSSTMPPAAQVSVIDGELIGTAPPSTPTLLPQAPIVPLRLLPFSRTSSGPFFQWCPPWPSWPSPAMAAGANARDSAAAAATAAQTFFTSISFMSGYPRHFRSLRGSPEGGVSGRRRYRY